jgi:glycosyltransferase involved in cell wall biosynthesis
MRVLVFTSLFPSPAWPTQWVYHVNLVRALSEFGRVTVVAPVALSKRVRHVRTLLNVSRRTLDGVTVHHPTVWTLPGFHHAHAGRMFQSTRPLVRQLWAAGEFDVILGIWAYPDAYVAGQLAEDVGCPVVVNVIGSDVNELPNRPGMRRKVEASLKSARTVIALSHALRDRVLELGVAPSNVVVQYNGVDGERFRPRPKEVARDVLGIKRDARLICYVGNLLPEKGPDVLLDAYRHLAKTQRGHVPDLVLLGDGPMMRPLQDAVRAAGHGATVRLLGRRLNDEVADWISAADVLCLPSLREGCPNVVLEALASGRPVVASHVGGVPELLNQRNGFTVPPAAPEKLAQALEAALAQHWCPDDLRSTVPCLSWRDFGAGFHRALKAAATAYTGQERSA